MVLYPPHPRPLPNGDRCEIDIRWWLSRVFGPLRQAEKRNSANWRCFGSRCDDWTQFSYQLASAVIRRML
jgi:hypothetical protein